MELPADFLSLGRGSVTLHFSWHKIIFKYAEVFLKG